MQRTARSKEDLFIMDIYQEHILDHYQNPRNSGQLKKPDIYYKSYNPLCGDEVAMFAKVENGRITTIKFLARGCAISQSAASMLTEIVTDKPLLEIKTLATKEMLDALMIPISHARTKCAMLALRTLQAGIAVFEAKHG